VQAVAIVIDSVTAPAAPLSVAASFLLYRSEMNDVPKPIASPDRTSSISCREDGACPASA
jgi:hypothetical protein